MQRTPQEPRVRWRMKVILLAGLTMMADAPVSAQDAPPSENSTEAAPGDAVEINERIRELESRVDALLARIEILEAKLSQARSATPESSALNRRATSPSPSVDIEEEIESFDSPELIIELMKEDFRNDLLRDPSFVLGIDSSNIRARDEAARVLGNWMEKSVRSFRRPVTWEVRTLRVRKGPDGETRREFQIIRPDGSTDSRTLELLIPNRFEKSVKDWRVRDGFKGLRIRGFVEPVVRTAPPPPKNGELRTEVAFDREAHVALNEWIHVHFDFQLSSVSPIFSEETDTGENDRREDTRDEL